MLSQPLAFIQSRWRRLRVGDNAELLEHAECIPHLPGFRRSSGSPILPSAKRWPYVVVDVLDVVLDGVGRQYR